MKINDKFLNASSDEKAIKMLPELVTFLSFVASSDNHALDDKQAALSLTKLADEAENLKFRMGYGY